MDLSSGRVLASAVGAVPPTATGVIQPPNIIRPSPQALDLFNAIEGESVTAQATVPSTIDGQGEGLRDGAPANDADSNDLADAGDTNNVQADVIMEDLPEPASVQTPRWGTLSRVTQRRLT